VETTGLQTLIAWSPAVAGQSAPLPKVKQGVVWHRPNLPFDVNGLEQYINRFLNAGSQISANDVLAPYYLLFSVPILKQADSGSTTRESLCNKLQCDDRDGFLGTVRRMRCVGVCER